MPVFRVARCRSAGVVAGCRQAVGRQAPRRQGVTELVEIGRQRVGAGDRVVVVTVERTTQPGDPDDRDQGDGDPQRDAQAVALHLVGPGLADHRLLLERSVGFLTFTLLGTHERGRLSAAASAPAALKRSDDSADDDSFGPGGIGASERVGMAHGVHGTPARMWCCRTRHRRMGSVARRPARRRQRVSTLGRPLRDRGARGVHGRRCRCRDRSPSAPCQADT